MERLLDNPILVKHVRTRLRKRETIMLMIVVLIICSFILGMGALSNSKGTGGVYTGLYMFFFFLQGAVLVAGGASQVASSIGQARNCGMLDFHRASPLRPFDLAIGFLLGGAIREYLIFALIFPFTLACAFMGTTGIGACLIATVVLVTSAFVFHALGLILGLNSKKSKNASGSIVALVIVAHVAVWLSPLRSSFLQLMTAAPVFIEALPSRVSGFSTLAATIFGFELPLALKSILYQIPVLLFLMLGCVRRLRSASAHLWSRPAAASLFAMLLFFAYCDYVQVNSRDSDLIFAMVLYPGFFLALFLLLDATPDAREFHRGRRRAAKQRLDQASPLSDLALNHAILAIFCGLLGMSILLLPMTNSASGRTDLPWMHAGFSVAALANLGSALQYFRLRGRKRWKAYFALFLFAICVVPMMLSGLSAMSGSRDIGAVLLSLSPLTGLAEPSTMGLAFHALLATFFVLKTRGEGKDRLALPAI